MKSLLLLCTLGFLVAYGAILPPPWADPEKNKCAAQPGGWLLLHWPTDGNCYRIFQRGKPCPETMELTPAHDSQGQITGECKCPPRTAQTLKSDVCYPIYTRGPCERGYYFAPIPSNDNKRMGHCLKIEKCRQNELFWPLTNKCYPKYSRGPCPEGQLITLNKDSLIAECQCSKTGHLSKYYWPPTKTCHQFYTRGPCLEKGTLFLPGPTCGCHQFLPNFDPETKRCYEIGGQGPCKFGQQFTLDPTTMTASCVCKPEHIPWRDGQCFRPYTKGPCNPNEILFKNSTCRAMPCSRGRLYFPENDSCYPVGARGPCGRGQLVHFEQSVKPSVEGISYRGVCGCTGYCNNTVEESDDYIEGRNIQSTLKEQPVTEKSGKMAAVDLRGVRICEKQEDPRYDSCYLLYTQGPCSAGEWLVPVRQGREERQYHRFGHSPEYEPSLFQKVRQNLRVRCDCKPGYAKDRRNNSCRLPLITLAQFLNGRDLFR